MDFEEIMDLLKEFSAVQVKGLEAAPKFHVYDNQTEGYILWTKINGVVDYACFVKGLAERHGLRVREYKDYLIIYK